ncbi:MAG: GrpB family protein, partial [Pseudonocardiaceae bacterium]
HLHLAESSHPEWRARLAFRNLLRAEPGIAAAYQQLEQRLAERYCHHREAYTQAKTAFVRDALAW